MSWRLRGKATSQRMQDVLSSCAKVLSMKEYEKVCLKLKGEMPCPQFLPKYVRRAIEQPPGASANFDKGRLPAAFWARLLPYQQAGIESIVGLFGGRVLLGDEMGLGKTLQAIAVALYYNLFPMLVVCPSYLRLNWKKEIEKWTEIPAEDITVVLKALTARNPANPAIFQEFSLFIQSR